MIYINDLVECTSKSNIDSTNCDSDVENEDYNDFVLFADDTNIFVVGENEDEVFLNAQTVLNNIFDYMYINQLHINLTKSAYIHFHPHLNLSERETCARTRISK